MAVGIISAPKQLATCRNDVWLEYACTNYRTGSAHTGGFMITRLASPPVGNVIKIVLPHGDVLTFRAVAGVPSDVGDEYTIGSLQNLANAMNNNVAFSALYIATVMSGWPQIYISGRWSWVPLPASITLNGAYYSQDDAQGSQDYIYALNYSVRTRIWVELDWMSNRWEPLPENDHYPGEDLHARENIAPMLLPFLGYDWPAYGQSAPMRTLSIFRRYRVQAWERYGTQATDHIAVLLPARVAWYAGQRNRDSHLQVNWGYTLGNTNVPSPWLTYRGRNGRHEVSAAQQHVLGWFRNLARPAGSVIRLRATVYYTDGTSAAINTVSDSGMPWERSEVALWPCGFNTLALYALQPSLTPYKYSVQLVYNAAGGAAVAASEEHTFWLADEETAELHIEYVNSLGIVDSLRCTGAWEEGLAVMYAEPFSKRSITGGNIPPPATSDKHHLLASADNTLKVSSGYMDESEYRAAMDLFFSPEVRLVDHANKRHLPLLLTNGSHAVSRRGAGTEEHLYALNLQFAVGDPERAWGDRQNMPMASQFLAGPAEPSPGESDAGVVL